MDHVLTTFVNKLNVGVIFILRENGKELCESFSHEDLKSNDWCFQQSYGMARVLIVLILDKNQKTYLVPIRQFCSSFNYPNETNAVQTSSLR